MKNSLKRKFTIKRINEADDVSRIRVLKMTHLENSQEIMQSEKILLKRNTIEKDGIIFYW